MNGRDKEDLIRKFIDGELSADEEAELMQSLADEDSFRKLVQLDNLLKNGLKDSFDVPVDFSNSVMQKIEAEHDKVPALQTGSVTEKIGRFFRRLFEPRTIAVRPAYGVVFAALVAVFFFLMPERSGISTSQQTNTGPANSAYITNAAEEENSVIWMRFVYADNNAKSIAIAGDFNNWQPIQMHRTLENDQTIWTITIPLPHKEIHYMFLKNGKKWLSDPLAPQQQDDGFGHLNSVIPL
ncbi:MAG TPA: hypothetical protein VKA08_02460 [Balneolales bacterium]|nr:hypothetical protein [Balneolales bacterium]